MRGRILQWWFAAVPALVGAALAVWGVGRAGPWQDELFTMHAVARGLGAHVSMAPLLPYYAVTWVWAAGGNLVSIEWLRLFSGLSIAGGSVALALAGRRLSSRWVGFTAAMLLVLAPGIGRYAQEARVYGVAAGLGAVATWALVEVLAGGSRRWWFLYGGALGLACFVLPAAWAIVPAHLVILLGFPEVRRHLRDGFTTLLFLTPVLGLGVLFGLYFPWFHSWLKAPTLADLPTGLYLPVHSEYTGPVVPILMVIAALLTARSRRWLLGLAVSVALVWVASYLFGSWWTARSFLPMAAVLCLAAAMGLARFAWPVAAIVLVAVFAIALPDQIAIRQEGSRGPDVRVIAAVIDAEGEAGDRVVEADSTFPLDWAVALYLNDDPRGFPFVPEAPADGRYWEIGDEASCRDFEEWPILGGATLRLCR